MEIIRSVQLASISTSFRAAVWSVFTSIASDIPAFDNPALENIQRMLGFVAEKLQFVRSLCTRFLLLPKSLDITRVSKETTIPELDGGSQHQALYYVHWFKTRILISEPPSYVSVTDVIAIVVSHVIGSPIPLPIGSLFLCPEG